MTQQIKQNRVRCNYQTENDKFLLECDFSKQYNDYYRKRLEKTRPYLEYNARSKWDPTIPIYDLAELASFSVDGDFDEPLSDVSPTLTSPTTQHGVTARDPGTPDAHKMPKRPRKVSEAKSDKSECIVIGTIYKRMKLQPNVVEELSKGDFHVKCERYLGHYTSQDDTLILEDLQESISLVGNINPKNFVTGICVAILGYSIGDGSQFLVRDICYAEPKRSILYDNTQLSRVRMSESSNELPIYLMVVSGLGFSHDMETSNSDLTQALQNMIDFIWGGGKFADDDRSSRVCRILVAGDSLHANRLAQSDGDDDDNSLFIDPDNIAAKMKRSRQVKAYPRSIKAVQYMDDFFAQLSKTINVDVMPGASDPSSHLFPQQHFHPCMFPKSCMFSTFNCTTNPHRATFNDNIELLATSGQNIDIIKKFSGLDDSLDIMSHHLKWANCAPSAPDNLYSVPYENEDPYVIDFIPDIYIAGCQESYQRKFHNYTMDNTGSQADKTEPGSPKSRTLLINVPRFDATFSCVLINLLDLESHCINFKC